MVQPRAGEVYKERRPDEGRLAAGDKPGKEYAGTNTFGTELSSAKPTIYNGRF